MQKKLIVLILLFLAACAPAGRLELALSNSVPTAVILPTDVAQIAATATPTAVPTRAPIPTEEPALTQSLSTVRLEQSAPRLDLVAKSAVLLDAESGDVLYSHHAHERMFPASTTKIMTALLALEHFTPDEIIWVGEEVNLAWTMARLDSQKAGLNYSQEISMRELLYGLLLPSGSDVAFVIAVNVARRESGDDSMPIDQAVAHFTDLMNARSRALGALETNFVNPDGYHDLDHYSTAYDLALISRQAMQDPTFRQIVAAPAYQPAEVTTDRFTFSRAWVNTNRLLDPLDPRYDPSATGIKTGTTAEAGHCLVSSAVFDGKLVIAVVLNSTVENVWSDSVRLLEYAKDKIK